MDRREQLEEIHCEAKMIGAAYRAVALASGQTGTPYGTQLADIVARLAKVMAEDDLAMVKP